MRVRDLLYPQAAPQVRLDFCLDGRMIYSVVDAPFHSRDGHWFIVDFKTDRIKQEDVGERTDEYLVQLGLYRAGIEKALGEWPRVVVYYLFPGVPMEIDAGRLAEVWDEVGTLFSSLGR